VATVRAVSDISARIAAETAFPPSSGFLVSSPRRLEDTRGRARTAA
jgi:hypothetical protein